jgi:signal transduction histidine kinase
MTDSIPAISSRPCSKYPHLSTDTCIYIDILENIDLGLLLLDIESESVILQNKSAISILAPDSKPMDYSDYKFLFLPDLQRQSVAGNFGTPRSLYYKDKLLGYTAYIIRDTFVWILIRDITEKARLESIAAEINTMDNIKYIFSGIRHELGNPINSIKMALSVLKTKLDICSRDTITEYVDRILAEISRVEYLLKSLKSFGMFDNPIIQSVNLASFFQRFASLTAEGLEKKGIELKIILNPEAQWIFADPRALQHAILNLVTNASDALEDRIHPVIQISSEKSEGMICIHVRDNGCGMSSKVCDNLFKPFYTTKPFGTGLGLTITKKMLTKMNGTIEIDSIKNSGTTATIKLPEGHDEG